MRRRAALGPIVALTSACSRPVALEVQWVQWFSYRDLADIAVGADGTVIAVGVEAAEYQPAFRPYRPWRAELTVDGAPARESLGFLGVYSHVAIASDGTAYTAQWQSGHLGTAGLECGVAVRAPDGREAMIRFVGDDGRLDCVEAMVTVGDRLVVHLSHSLVGVRRDGSEAWRVGAPPGTQGSMWHVDGTTIWMAGTDGSPITPGSTQPALYGLDAGSGAIRRIDVGEPGWRITALGPALDGFVTAMVSDDLTQPKARIVGVSADGAVRWQRPAPARVESVGTRPSHLPGADPTQPILLTDGGHMRARLAMTGDESDESLRQRFVVLDRFDHGGRPAGAASLSFSEDIDDARDRIDCPPNDTPPDEGHGAYPWASIGLGPTTLLLAGRHGCRDSWVALVEVAP